MIYITGDIHRDFSRIYKLKKDSDNMLIVLGDVGINYYLNEEDKNYKEYLKKLKLRDCSKINVNFLWSYN